MDIYQESVELHKKLGGKLEVVSKHKIKDKKDMSLLYTPGVAEPCKEIAKNPEKVFELTIKKNSVAIVSDGSAILGLGNLGAKAAIPVMEGKAVLFKEFGNIDAFPICLDTQKTEEIIETVKRIAPVFGGINLEDISAPRCFEIEERLQNIGIPVFHDDQHGTAIVVLAGLINALKITKKKISDVKIVVSGSGAAGIAITKLLLGDGAKNVILIDTKGAVYQGRKENMNPAKEEIAKLTNPNKEKGSLKDVIKNADVFIGVSAPNIMTAEDVKNMNSNPIVFAMSNPIPEIMPDEAIKGGAFIVATGRSDFPNQVNNVLAFPGIFRGAFDAKAKRITPAMKLAAVHALADSVENPTPEQIIPSVFDKNAAKNVAEAVKKAAE
ncbi:NADP-dependent malic enzyme [Candidatus Woesearchaeota archaeon]|nr:NADP-dependent malic enzyme [Candidatus Woesearchaeota archaeon]